MNKTSRTSTELQKNNSPRTHLLRGPAHKHLSKVINQSVASAPSIPTKYECILNSEKPDNDGFGNRTERFPVKKHEVAGPGAYFDFHNRDFLKESPSISKKGFGSVIARDKRFFDNPPPTFNPPGPGGYDLESSFKHIHSKWSDRYIGPSSNFIKPTSKSITSTQTHTTIGPGYYETLNNPNYSTMYKEKPMSMFKSKTERGVHIPKSTHVSKVNEGNKDISLVNSDAVDEIPKQEIDRIIHKDTQLPNAVFRSGSNRGVVPKEGVGPGYYNPSIPIDIQKGKKKLSSFFANTDKLDRFGNPIIRFTRHVEVPAPGTYNIPSSFKTLNEYDGLDDPTIPKSSIFMSTTKRFKDPKFPGPAPGQYEGTQKLIWNKRSFKVTKTDTWNP